MYTTRQLSFLRHQHTIWFHLIGSNKWQQLFFFFFCFSSPRLFSLITKLEIRLTSNGKLTCPSKLLVTMGSKLVLMDCGKALDPWIVVTRTSCWSVIILFTPGFLFPDTPTVTSSVTTGVVIPKRLISAQLLQIAAIRVWPSIPMVTDPSALDWWVSVCVSSHWLWLRFSFYLVLWLTSNHVKFNSTLMVWRGQFLSNLINLKSETYWLL